MNVEQYEKLQKKLAEALSNRDKAKGVIEQIEAQWKETHNLKDAEAAAAKIEELIGQIKETEEKYQKLLDSAEKLMEPQSNE